MAGFWEVTGHKMYPSIGDVSPEDANRTILWKSGNPSIASVDSKGVITCKKQGATTVTATSKYGAFSVSLPVIVLNNGSYYTTDDCFDDLSEYDEDWYYTTAKSIYAKNGYLYVDMYILNMYSFTIKRLSKQAVYLTLYYSDTESTDDYAYVGSFTPTLKGKIAPYTIGVATFKLGRINSAKAWLIDADAYCEGRCSSKDIGAEPKAAIPGISGASRPAGKAKPACRGLR